MSIWHAIVLGVVQGLTEFIPVSSSGHLQLVPWLFGWDDFAGDENLENAFDVALHIGTLAGALSFFYRDVMRYTVAGFGGLGRGPMSQDGRIAWLLVVSAIPAGITGVALESVLASDNHLWLTAVALIVFGVALWASDRLGGSREVEGFQLRDAVTMGLGQALALQPGVSRSGVTMSVARLLRFDRTAATRLSFLMSLPIIAGAGVFKFLDVGGLDGIPSDVRAAFLAGMIAAAVTGWLAVWGTLRIVQRMSFQPFMIYRVVAGVAVLALLNTSWR